MIGYDLEKLNLEEIEDVMKSKGDYPDAILVQRIYPDRKKKKRIWKLKRLEKEGVMVEEKGKKKKIN